MASYRERSLKVRDLSGALTLLLGIGIFAFSGVSLVEANHIAWNGVAATGSVVSIDEGRGKRGRRLYAPVYRFTDRNGEEFIGRQNIKLGWKSAEIGQTVAVLYDPTDPSRSVINSVWGRFGHLPAFLFSIVLAVFGAIRLIRDFK